MEKEEKPWTRGQIVTGSILVLLLLAAFGIGMILGMNAGEEDGARHIRQVGRR